MSSSTSSLSGRSNLQSDEFTRTASSLQSSSNQLSTTLSEGTYKEHFSTRTSSNEHFSTRNSSNEENFSIRTSSNEHFSTRTNSNEHLSTRTSSNEENFSMRTLSSNESMPGVNASMGDETNDDDDDSLIFDDTCSQSSTSSADNVVHLVSKDRLEPNKSTSRGHHDFTMAIDSKFIQDKPPSPTFLTEYQDKLPSTTETKVSEVNLKKQLLEAVETGDHIKMIAVLRSGADMNCTDSNGRSLMHIACSFGHAQIVQLLIEHGFNVDVVSKKNKQTPLHETCIGGHTKVLRMLLSEVADLDVLDHLGRSPAHYCAIHGEGECLEILCEQGCDVCLEDYANRTGVHFAAMNNHPDIIRLLMERGADLDVGESEGKTPAHYAARHGSLEALEALLRNAIDLSEKDEMGSLITHEAAFYDKLQCLKLLIKKGIQWSSQDVKGRNVLHKAAQGKSQNCLHWILSRSKLEVDSKDFNGNTALHYCAANGFSEGYHCLLQHGASQDCCSSDGKTPFDIARSNGKFSYIEKAVNGRTVCKLCDRVDDRDVSGVSSSSSTGTMLTISNSKDSLFRIPEYVKCDKQTSSPKHKKEKEKSDFNQTIKKSANSEITHFTLAAKYYGPSL